MYLATDLYDESAEAGEEERIEIVEVPLERLDQTIEALPRRQEPRRPALVQGLPGRAPDGYVAASRDAGTAAESGWAWPRSPYSRVASRPFEHLVLDFLAYLEFERGLSRNTLEAYRSDLLQFGRFLEERGLSALTAERATSRTS